MKKQTRDPIHTSIGNGQAGGGLLGTVAAMGAILVIVQGGIFYQSRNSARLQDSEKKKILSQQLAEAGIEDNIAEMGTRRFKVRMGSPDTLTFANKPLGAGRFTTKVTTVGVGAEADTVDLVSQGAVGSILQSVAVRLRLKKYLDTTQTPIHYVAPETTLTFTSRTVPETTFNSVVQNPNTMPALNATPAYEACMTSAGKKCDICHLPDSDVSKAEVITVNKSSINTHIGHHGDYVTTDGSCDVYKEKLYPAAIVPVVKVDTNRAIVDKTVYDTHIVVDTAVKVQILSWR